MGGPEKTRGARFSRRWCVLLGAVLLAGGSAAGLWWGQTHFVRGFENAHLEIPPESLDFGEVWEQEAFGWTLPIHNRSSRRVTISRLLVSCRCAEADPSSVVVPPGQTAQVRMTLDLTARRPCKSCGTDSDRRPFSARIVPVIEGGLPQYRGWKLEGVVCRPLRLAPRTLGFGDSLVDGEAFEPQTADVTADVPLAGLAAEIEGEAPAEVAVEQGEEAGGYRVRVAPHEAAPVGRYRFDVVLRGTTPSGETLPPVRLPVVMDVLHDVRPQPAGVTFGSLALGESDDDVVTLHSRTGKPFVVAGTAFDPRSGLSVERVAEVEGMPCFRVCQRAVALCWHEQEVRFTVQDPSGQAARQIALKVDYYGVEGSSSGSQ